MKNNIKSFFIISGIIEIILGSALHFTYSISGNNNFIALFSSINESTWEHLKLLFFPMLLTTIIGYNSIYKSSCCFLCARAFGIFISISFTIIFFYTYSGILGKNIPLIDISSFFLSVIIGEYTSCILIKNSIACDKKAACIFLFILTICFFLFTFYPPHIGLFKDPVSGTYGIEKEL